MSGVGFMERLLDGMSVKWQPLESIAKIKHGKDWKGLSSGDVPVYGSGGIMGYVGEFSYDKPTVLIPRKGSITNIFYVETPFWNVDTVYYTEIDTNRMLPKYLYYFIKTIDLMALDTGSGRPSLTQAILNQLPIPIPCPENPKKSLEIQAEIVRILDAFTAMTAELTAELSTRQKQYNYYRDQLLSFEEGEVEWKTLREVCEIGDGNHSSKYPRSDEMVDEGVSFIRGTNMVNGTISVQDMKFITPEKHQELRKGHLKAFDVLITNRGEIGKIAQIPKHFAGSNLNSQLAWLRADQEVLLPRFLFYVLNASHVQSSISGEGGALQQLTIKNIKLIRIPVPSPEGQARVVAILDKFDTLTNSITEGLPREIELRQKQYEYYRDLLLSFPRPEAQKAIANA